MNKYLVVYSIVGEASAIVYADSIKEAEAKAKAYEFEGSEELIEWSIEDYSHAYEVEQ